MEQDPFFGTMAGEYRARLLSMGPAWPLTLLVLPMKGKRPDGWQFDTVSTVKPNVTYFKVVSSTNNSMYTCNTLKKQETFFFFFFNQRRHKAELYGLKSV